MGKVTLVLAWVYGERIESNDRAGKAIGLPHLERAYLIGCLNIHVVISRRSTDGMNGFISRINGTFDGTSGILPR